MPVYRSTIVPVHTEHKTYDTKSVPCSRLYGTRVEAVEVPQPPLRHPEASGVVHKDEALLDALIIDCGGDVPWAMWQPENTKYNYENTAAAAASGSGGQATRLSKCFLLERRA